mgnify:FL=1
MKEKSNYWIASVVAANIVAFEILFTLIFIIVQYFFLSAQFMQILSSAFTTIFGVLLGSWYAARYLKSRTAIKGENIMRIAIAVSLLLLILYYFFSVAGLSWNLFAPGSGSSGGPSIFVGLLQDLAWSLIYSVFVYFVVRRDLRKISNTQIITPTNEIQK